MENLFRAAGPVNTGAGSVTKNPCGVVPESRGFDFMQVMQMVLKGNSLHSPASLQQPPVLSQTVHTAKQNNATQPRTVPEYMQEPQLNKVPHPAGDSQPDSIVRGSVPVNAGPQDCGNENYFATGTADNPSEGDRSRQPGLKPGPGAVNVQAGQGTPTLELLRQLLGGQAGDTGETLMNTGASVDNQLQAQWPALLRSGPLANFMQAMQLVPDGNALNSPASLQQPPVLSQTVHTAKQNNATQPRTVPEYMQEPQLNKVPHPAGDSQPDSIVRGSVPVNAGPQDRGNENYFATGTADNLSEGDRSRQPDLKPCPGAANVQAGQAAPAVELLRQLITGQTGVTGETLMNTGVSADNQLPAQWPALLQGGALADLLQVMQTASDGNSLNSPANLQQSPVLQQTVNLAKQNNATQPGTVPEYMQEPQLNKVPHPAGDSQPDSIVRGSVPVNAGPQDHGNENYFATGTVDNLSEGDRSRQPDLKPGPGAVNVQAGQAAPAVELLRQLITGQTGATGETSMNTGVSADNQLPAQWLALLQGAPLTDLLQVMQMAPDGNALNTPANLQQSPVLQQTVNLAKQNNATQPGTVPEYMQEPQLNKVPHPAGDSQPDSIVRGSVPVNAGPQDHGNEHYYATSTGIMQELKQVLRLTQFYRAASPIHAGNANDPAEDSHTQSFSSANGGTAVDPGLKSAQRPGIELRTVPGAANPQPARTTVLVELLQDLTGNKDHFNNYINGNFKQNTLNREQIEQVRGSLTGKPDSQLPRVPDQAGKIATDSKSIEAVQISHVKSDRAASTTNPAEDTKNNGDHKQQLQELPTTTNPNNNLGGAAKVAHKATLPVLRPGEKAFYMQLAETIRGHISNVGQGQTYVKLQLQPEHLGEVIIKLAYRDGNLSTHFHAATEHAKQIIESSIGQLRETLAGFQLNLQNVSVSVGGDSGRWGQEWNQDRQFKKQRGLLKNSLETTGEVTVEGSSETSTAGNLGKLNHFV